MSRGALYARTLVHLHPAQILLRPMHLARTRLLASSATLAHRVAGDGQVTLGPPILDLVGTIPSSLVGVAPELARAKRALAGTQRLVGLDLKLAPPRTDFEASLPKLATYQQAYLSIARSLAVAARTDGFERRAEAATLAVAHIREFVERVPPGHGAAWEPYPVAMRLLNLIVARELLLPEVPGAEAGFLNGPLLHSLGQHARWLAMSLEVHLLGNHLFTDGVALFVAGCALETPGHMTWRGIGYGILARSLATDVLQDGGHSERSPMYAGIYCDQLALSLAAARANGIPPPPGATSAVASLVRFLTETAHPDGDIPLLGDSALDEAPLPADLAGAAGMRPDSLRRRLYGVVSSPEAITHHGTHAMGVFPDTGIIAIHDGTEALVIDGGPLGAEDQPGHAHADALAFELTHAGQRLISDAGAGHYQDDEARAYCRGPLGHSSVSVDGKGSDEVWSVWRAGRRAELEPLADVLIDGVHVIRGALQAPWGWRQERTLVYCPNVILCVVDRIRSAHPTARVVSHIHFGPAASATLRSGQAIINQSMVLKSLIGGGLSLHQGEGAPSGGLPGRPFRGWTSLRFGEFVASPELEMEATGVGNEWRAAWALLLAPDAAATVEGDVLHLTIQGRTVVVSFDPAGTRWELIRPPSMGPAEADGPGPAGEGSH